MEHYFYNKILLYGQSILASEKSCYNHKWVVFPPISYLRPVLSASEESFLDLSKLNSFIQGGMDDPKRKIQSIASQSLT